MTVLPYDIPYGLKVLPIIIEIVLDGVTYFSRHEPKPVTVLATRPPDYLSKYDCPYRRELPPGS